MTLTLIWVRRSAVTLTLILTAMLLGLVQECDAAIQTLVLTPPK